jgi:hypothetical protein
MNFINWTEVRLIIQVCVDNGINASVLNENQHYLIDKLADDVFEDVRKKQLKEHEIQNIKISNRKTRS